MATLAFTVQNPPVRIDWADGTVEFWQSSPATHLYAAGGIPAITLTDSVHGLAATAEPICPTWNTVNAQYVTWDAVQTTNATWNDLLGR